MKLVVVAVVTLFVAHSNAWFFLGRNEETTATADGRPIDEECIEHGENGDCEFFNCFEQRLPCGHDFYMMRFGNHYCNRFQRFMDDFTEEGQRFLQDSQQCITQQLINKYQEDYYNCHTLEHEAIALIRPCYTQHGFCDIIGDNTEQFLRAFQIRHLFSTGAGKLWREVVGLARECGGRALNNFWRATASSGISSIRNIFRGRNSDDK